MVLYAYDVNVWCTPERNVLDSLELELHVVVIYHVGAGN